MFLRKQNNTDKKFKLKIWGIMIVGAIVGLILDKVLPVNFWFNCIRCVVALAFGMSLYSILYLFSLDVYDRRKTEDTSYQTWRERFSLNQRINISLLSGVGMTALYLILCKPTSPGYTVVSGMLFAFYFTLLAFSRSSKDEYLKTMLGARDSRDVKFKEQREKKAREKEAEKQKKEKK